MDVRGFKKNHPKNLIGYALAVSADEDTQSVFEEYVIKSVEDARLDAISLDLIRTNDGEIRLTPSGRESVRTLRYHYGGTLSALQVIDGLSGSSKRLVDTQPVMGVVARQAMLAYAPTQAVVGVLDTLADEGHREPTLAKLAKTMGQKHPKLALDLFVNPSSKERVRPSSGDGLQLEEFDSGQVYWTNTTFQYKALLYHSGLLTTRGHDKKSTLDPSSSIWSLENTMSSLR